MSLIKFMSGWLTGTGAPQGDISLATLGSCASFEGSRADLMALTSLSTVRRKIRKGNPRGCGAADQPKVGVMPWGGPERGPCTEHGAEPASIPAPGMHLEWGISWKELYSIN